MAYNAPIRSNGMAKPVEHYSPGTSYTGPQTPVITLTGQIDHQSPVNRNQHITARIDYNKARAMRRDPTISLARLIAVAPILIPKWDYLTTKPEYPQEWADFIAEYVEPIRKRFMRSLLFGEFDYGWKAFEKVFTVVYSEQFGQRVILKKLKPLVNDNTWEVLDTDGEFDGLIHKSSEGMANLIRIDRTHSLFVNFNDDDTGAYGEPTIARAEAAYDEWLKANDVCKRFDEKIAGALWHIQYPEGKEPYYKGKRNVDRSEIADDIAASIKASGILKTPSQLQFVAEEALKNLGQAGWHISLLESSSKAGDLVPRLDYLDKLKTRACGVLERTILEGNYGTKAEAEAHLNVMLLAKQLKLSDVADCFNDCVIDQLTDLNYGQVNVVKAQPQAIVGNQKEHMVTVLTALFANPDSASDVISNIDLEAVLDILDIPSRSEDEMQERERDKAGGLLDIFRTALDSGEAVTETQATTEAIPAILQGGQGNSAADPNAPVQTFNNTLDPTAVEVRLNGAQITAGLEILSSVSSGAIDADAAVSLMESLGIEQSQARLIVNGANIAAAIATVPQ